MALGIQTESSGGDFLPYIKYDARAGRMFKAESVQTANGFDRTMVDITQDAVFAADLENIQVGWLDFPTGTAPIRALVHVGEALPPKPTEKARQGIELHVWGQKLGGWRVLSSNAQAVTQAIDGLHNQFLIAPERKQNLMPVIRLTGAVPVKSQGGGKVSTNYSPIFAIEGWIPRPAEPPLQGSSQAAQQPAQQAMQLQPAQQPTQPAQPAQQYQAPGAVGAAPASRFAPGAF